MEDKKMTWSEFVKLISITVVILTAVVGGIQFLFSSFNNAEDRLIRLEERLKTIEENHIKHLNNKIEEVKECQDEQGKKIDKVDKTTVKILEKIK